jgi:hypothetical protein
MNRTNTHGPERSGGLARRVKLACLARPELLGHLLALLALFSIGFV